MRNFLSAFLVTFLCIECALIGDALLSKKEPVVEATITPPVLVVSVSQQINYQMHCTAVPPKNFDALIEGAAKEFGIAATILATTVYRESGCDQHALGSSGEIGLAQVHPKYWSKTLIQEGITSDLKDPATNLRASAYILSRLGATTSTNGLHEIFRKYNGSGKNAERYARSQVRVHTALWGSSSKK